MAKLTFRYGTTGSGKTLDLIKVFINYEENGKRVIILTSKIDNRYGHDLVKSRAGIKKDAIGVGVGDNIIDIIEYQKTLLNDNLSCILVDEVQFFSIEQIHQLSEIVDVLNIPVICYGLRGDFKQEPFESTSTLMTIADSLEEMKTICSNCGEKKATISSRFINGRIVTTGEKIEIGGNDKYRPLCRKCYKKLINQ